MGSAILINCESFPTAQSILDLINNEGEWSMFSGKYIKVIRGSNLEEKCREFNIKEGLIIL